MTVTLLLFASFGCSVSRTQLRSKDSNWLAAQFEQTGHDEQRKWIVEELALRRDPEMIPILCSYTRSNEQVLRQKALRLLNDYAGKEEGIDPTYIELLSSSDGTMRRLAVEGMILRFQMRGEVPYLEEALIRILRSSPRWQERLHAVEVLEWVKSESVPRQLLDVGKSDENASVRAVAVRALGTQRLSTVRKDLYRISQKDLDAAVREEAKRSLQKIGGTLEDVVVAVMPFDTPAKYQDVAAGFRSYLSGRLSSSNIAKVVERGQVQSVVDELIYQDNNINDGKAVEIGKALRASQVVTGNIQVLNGQVVITIKRIDVKTQQILSSAQSSGSYIDFDAVQRHAANAFVESF